MAFGWLDPWMMAWAGMFVTSPLDDDKGGHLADDQTGGARQLWAETVDRPRVRAHDMEKHSHSIRPGFKSQGASMMATVGIQEPGGFDDGYGWDPRARRLR